MNILMITLRSDIGGGPKHLMDLTQEILTSFKEHRLFIASPLDPPFGESFSKRSVEFFQLNHRTFSLIKLLELFLFCRRNKIDLVHSHGRGAGIYSRFLGIMGYKVIHTFHGAHIEKGFLGKLKVNVDRLLSLFTNRFICVSYDESMAIKKNNLAPSKKIAIVRNGVHFSKSLPPREIKRENIVVGTLARFNYQKGLDILVKGISQYVHQFEKSKFILKIGGDGELKEQIQKKIQDLNLTTYITLEGFVDPLEFLNEIDVYISFARWEGLPLSVLEAMGQGVPCLISDVEGHGEFKEKDVCKMFPLDDMNQFCHQFDQILRDSQLREKLSLNGYTLIKNEFNVPKMTLNTINEYKSLTRDNP